VLVLLILTLVLVARGNSADDDSSYNGSAGTGPVATASGPTTGSN
jgi:hypothetical protein